MLLLAVLFAQSADPQVNNEYGDAVKGYYVCLDQEARRLDDGKDTADTVFSAAVESCKKERGLLIGYGALLEKERHPQSSVEDGFKYGNLLADEMDKRLKPKIALTILDNRAAK